MLYVNNEFRTPRAGAQLDDEVGAAAERPRLVAMCGEQLYRVRDCFGGFIRDCVQGQNLQVGRCLTAASIGAPTLAQAAMIMPISRSGNARKLYISRCSLT